MKVTLLNEFGRKRANPEANSANTLRLPGCACTPDTVCEEFFSLAAAAGKTITGISVDGNAYTFDAVAADDANAIFNALYPIIRKYEADPVSIVAKMNGTAMEITHIGATELKITFNGSESTPTRCCLFVFSTEYSVLIPVGDAGGDLDINGTAVTIASTDVDADDEGPALQTKIRTTHTVSVVPELATVEYDAAEDAYLVKVYADSTWDAPTYDGTALEPTLRNDVGMFFCPA